MDLLLEAASREELDGNFDGPETARASSDELGEKKTTRAAISKESWVRMKEYAVEYVKANVSDCINVKPEFLKRKDGRAGWKVDRGPEKQPYFAYLRPQSAYLGGHRGKGYALEVLQNKKPRGITRKCAPSLMESQLESSKFERIPLITKAPEEVVSEMTETPSDMGNDVKKTRMNPENEVHI